MGQVELNKIQRMELVALHLGSFFVPVLVSMAFFLIEDEDFIKQSAKNNLNFQLSIVIYLFISLLLSFVIVGLLGLIVFPLMFYILTLVSLINSCNGNLYEFPMTIKFIK